MYLASSVAPTDTVVWVHGGAFVVGDLAMPESHWVGLALAASGCDVIALDYRKALHGTTFPAPSDDVIDGWLWACEHQAAAGRGQRIHLGGASAGGNLVAGVTKRLLDGEGRPPDSLILVYPLLAARLETSDLGSEAESDVALELLSIATLEWSGAAGIDDPVAFASNGPIHPHHPDTLFVLAEDDMLRAHASRYADQLASAGIGVRLSVVHESVHGFLNEPSTHSGEDGLAALLAWLRPDYA